MRKRKILQQDLAKTKTEIDILTILINEGKRIRWKDLLEKAGISSRTLAARLKELTKKGDVNRIVDSKVYPPAVYYEASSSAYVSMLPLRPFLNQMDNMLDQWQQTRRIIETGESDPEKLIDNLLKEYVWDLVFTLNYCVEYFEKEGEKSYWPFLVFYHVRAYESRIMELIRVATKSPKLRTAIKSYYQEFKKERDEDQRKLLESIIAPFNDKELAKPMMRQYCLLLIQGIVEKPSDFLQQLSQNEKLKQKIEEDFGQSISDERLNQFLADPGWKAHSLIKSNEIELIEKSRIVK
jgi:DNA-binding HxlR family transcriptional regulator